MHPKSNQTADPLPPIPDVISQIQESPTDPPIEMRQEENNQEIQTQSQILPVISESNTKGIR